MPRGKIRFGLNGLYAHGAAAGYTPAEVDSMSLWQFRAALGGWQKSQGAQSEDFTAEDVDELEKLMTSSLERAKNG